MRTAKRIGLVVCAIAASFATPGEVRGAASPSFSEAWYREVVLGDLALAGENYLRLSTEGGVGTSKGTVSSEVRREAALRAGGCFERTGDLERAREAYAWLLRSSPPDDPAVRYARGRLLLIPEKKALPQIPEGGAPPKSAGGSGSPPQGAGEVKQSFERLKGRVERREAFLSELQGKAGRLAEQVREEKRLRERFRELDLDLRFRPDSRTVKNGALGDSPRTLDPEDREILLRELAERYYLRGLRALRDRDPRSAVEEFRKCLEFSTTGDFSDARELLEVAEGFLKPMEGLSELAAERIQERSEKRKLEILQLLRNGFASSQRLASQDQGPQALLSLERMRLEGEWTPVLLRPVTEMRALLEEAEVREILDSIPSREGIPEGGSAAADRYRELLSRGRKAAAGILEAAEDLEDLSHSSSERLIPNLTPPPSGKAADTEFSDLNRKVAEELERLFVAGEEKRRLWVEDRSVEGWKKEFIQIWIICRWFPGADPGGLYGRIAGGYLGW